MCSSHHGALLHQALADLKGKTEAIPCVIGGEEVWTPTVRYQLSVSVGEGCFTKWERTEGCTRGMYPREGDLLDR